VTRLPNYKLALIDPAGNVEILVDVESVFEDTEEVGELNPLEQAALIGDTFGDVAAQDVRLRLDRVARVLMLDEISEQLDEPNLRGFLVRCKESKFYRAPPRGVADDPPLDLAIKNTLGAALVNARRAKDLK